MLRRSSQRLLLALVCAVAFQAGTAQAQAPRPPFPFGLNERYFGYRPRVYGYWPSAYVYPRYGYTRGTGYDLYHFPAPPPGSGFPNQPYGSDPDWLRARMMVEGGGNCIGDAPANGAFDADVEPLGYPVE